TDLVQAARSPWGRPHTRRENSNDLVVCGPRVDEAAHHDDGALLRRHLSHSAWIRSWRERSNRGTSVTSLSGCCRWHCCSMLAARLLSAPGFPGGDMRLPGRYPPWRLASFSSGIFVVFIATASPLEALSGLLLHAHMLQHMLLILAAPPLIWLGMPIAPAAR